MPLMSSSVSVGRPIIKYSFMRSQPWENDALTAFMRSSSVTPLLMTSRMRCVPASGAKVRPPFFSPATSLAISTPKESRRSEGSDTEMPLPDRFALSLRSTSSRLEWSVVDSEVSETWS